MAKSAASSLPLLFDSAPAAPAPEADAPPAPTLSPGTPMMQQYWALKNAHPDCLLFFRMGDFYELFHDDAVTAAPVLDVALTRRGKDAGEDVPMAGVPVHAYEAYIPKLIKAGFKVAVAEQMEDPAAAKKRAKEEGRSSAKALVERQVIRILTPGTLTEDGFLTPGASCFLAALLEQAGRYALAWCDLGAAIPFCEETGDSGLPALLARINPAELVLSDALLGRPDMAEILAPYKDRLSPLPSSRFDAANAAKRAAAHYKVASLDAFGIEGRASASALGVLIDYIVLTQKQPAEGLARPQKSDSALLMAIDAATRRNLELTETLTGTRKGSLLGCIDLTLTQGGARLLADRLAAPLTGVDAIQARQEQVDFFTADSARRAAVRGLLKSCPDLSRALTRLMLKRGGPRDLAVIRAALETAMATGAALDRHSLPSGLLRLRRALGEHSALIDTLSRALGPSLPMQARDGGFIAPGYSAALDELTALRDDSRRLIAALQARYVADTKIPSLKIKYNQVMGYHIELTPSHADKLLQPPFNATYIHRQSLVSAVRFTTAELAELERKVSEAAGRALALELTLFDELAAQVLAQQDSLRGCASALAEWDVAAALAELAAEKGWVKPRVDDSLAFHITGGRHPVVETALHAAGEAFVPNDCDLSPESRLWLMTGPNMAGKSTFLRQNALIAVLAQMGSYVPAAAAHIGVVDKLFSRVGAADDLARGRSTFMVEMIETAAILNQAGPRALVILDEIGRGTATFDGLSIAWGALEYIYHQNQCRGLFATHYHELTALCASLPGLVAAQAKVKEWEGKIVFLHAIARGSADHSYGIHVAELAGLPAGVLARARQVLADLESRQHGKVTVAPASPDAFRAPPRMPSAAEKALDALDPDSLSPKEALETLYRLKELAAARRR